jgi:16S rRNA (cytidine1402-2'-O)-methyltransferase
MPGTLFVVATPIGNLEDISARAVRTLREVALIAAEDTRRTAHLLTRYAISTPTTSLHEHNESKKGPSLVARLARGESIALVSDAGTPTISDPGARLIRSAIDAGIRVEAIPGPSAVMTALASSGLPTDSFLFLGFPPVRSKDRKLWLAEVAKSSRTVVCFEAPHRLRRTLEDLQRVTGDRVVVVAREITKIHEELVRGPISVLLERLQAPRGEYTLVISGGHSTNNDPAEAPDAAALAAEFGKLTDFSGLSRKEAISTLASRHRLPRNQVYSTLEDAKKSGV